MAMESSIILRTAMIHILKADTLEDAFEDVKALGSKDDVDAVMQDYLAWCERHGRKGVKGIKGVTKDDK